MLGVIIALLVAGINMLFGHDIYEVYLIATSFLHIWYIWTTVVMSIVVILFTIGLTVFGAAAGSSEGKIGAVFGFLVGGALSVLTFLRFIIKRTLFIVGSLLLTQALDVTGEPTWDAPKLIIAGLLLFIAIVVLRSSSSVSSDSSSSK